MPYLCPSYHLSSSNVRRTRQSGAIQTGGTGGESYAAVQPAGAKFPPGARQGRKKGSKKSPAPIGAQDFLHGSGRRIRTLTYGVRVRCATFTQSRFVADDVIIHVNFHLSRDFFHPAKIFSGGRAHRARRAFAASAAPQFTNCSNCARQFVLTREGNGDTLPLALGTKEC